MSFKPHIILLLKEAAFIRYLESLEKNTLKEYFSSKLPEIKQIDNKNPLQLDEANNAMIQLYDLLTQLLQKSYALKNNSRNQNAVIVVNYLTELKDFVLKTHQHILALKDQPELWSYLLNKQGRVVFYYLIYLNLIHNDLLNLAPLTHELLNALEMEGCSTGSEQLILQFLHVRLDLIGTKQHHALDSVDVRVNNPFINAYWLLQSLEELPHSDDKFDVVSTLNDRPLNIDPAIPNFILQFIQLQYATLFVKGMGHEETSLQQMASAKKLAESGYLPANMEQADGIASIRCVKHTTDLVYYVYRVMYSFALFNDPNLMIRQWHTHLMFFQVFLFYYMMHGLPEAELSKTKATLTEDMLTHFTTALNLIRLTQNSPEDVVTLLQGRTDLFWAAEKSIFCPQLLVSPHYVVALSKNIQLIIAAFVNQDRLAEACDILAAVIEFQELYDNFRQKEHTFYSNLLIVLWFIRDLPNPIAQKSDESINTLLSRIEAKKYVYKLTHRELEQAEPELRNKLRFIFVSKLQDLLTQLDKASITNPGQTNQCYFIARQLAQTFAIPDKEFNRILPYQIKDFDWAEDIKTEKKLEAVRKKKRIIKSTGDNSSSSSTSSQVFFKSQENDAAYVPRDALPQAILDFADFIYKHTGIELILGGSAATFLYLKKNNPRDYDFILLKISKEELLKLLTENGYKAQLVGSKVPIVKVKLETSAGALSLDLSTEIIESCEPLTKTMESLLVNRDFKLSALYVVVKPGAKQIEVKGFDRAIRSLNSKLISVVNHQHSLFTDEPIRLFRLVKNCLQYPDFQLDDELKNILSATDIKKCFTTYLQNPAFALVNRGQISTAMEILFDRFEINAVLKKMDELGILSSLTDLRYENIEDSVRLLDPYNAKDAYSKKKAVNLFLHMHYLLLHPNIQKLNGWLFYGVARCVKPACQDAFNKVEDAVFNVKANAELPEGELKEWLTHIQAIQQRNFAARAP